VLERRLVRHNSEVRRVGKGLRRRCQRRRGHVNQMDGHRQRCALNEDPHFAAVAGSKFDDAWQVRDEREDFIAVRAEQAAFSPRDAVPRS
jgi:hypothetical protein